MPQILLLFVVRESERLGLPIKIDVCHQWIQLLACFVQLCIGFFVKILANLSHATLRRVQRPRYTHRRPIKVKATELLTVLLNSRLASCHRLNFHVRSRINAISTIRCQTEHSCCAMKRAIYALTYGIYGRLLVKTGLDAAIFYVQIVQPLIFSKIHRAWQEHFGIPIRRKSR